MEELGYKVPYTAGCFGWIKNNSMGPEHKKTQEEIKKQKEEYNSRSWELTTWKKVATKYGLHYHNQLNIASFLLRFLKVGYPIALRLPCKGYFCRESFLRLIEILKEESNSDELYVLQAPPCCTDDHWIDGLQIARWEELPEYFNEDFLGVLNALDRSWSVYTAEDLHYTIVGGTKELIANILSTKELEAVECIALTRIDSYSDQLNDKITAEDSEWVWRI